MREILETMLRDVETETAPMRVLYEAQTKESNRRRYQKRVRMNTHGSEFRRGKPIGDLSFITLVDCWNFGFGNHIINRVFPINTEGYLK